MKNRPKLPHLIPPAHLYSLPPPLSLALCMWALIAEIRRMADMCLDLIMEYDRDAKGGFQGRQWQSIHGEESKQERGMRLPIHLPHTSYLKQLLERAIKVCNKRWCPWYIIPLFCAVPWPWWWHGVVYVTELGCIIRRKRYLYHNRGWCEVTDQEEGGGSSVDSTPQRPSSVVREVGVSKDGHTPIDPPFASDQHKGGKGHVLE